MHASKFLLQYLLISLQKISFLATYLYDNVSHNSGQAMYDNRTLCHRLNRNQLRKPNTNSCNIQPRKSGPWSLTTSFLILVTTSNLRPIRESKHVTPLIIGNVPLLVNLPPLPRPAIPN